MAVACGAAPVEPVREALAAAVPLALALVAEPEVLVLATEPEALVLASEAVLAVAAVSVV